jgi:hypothetical protein
MQCTLATSLDLVTYELLKPFLKVFLSRAHENEEGMAAVYEIMYLFVSHYQIMCLRVSAYNMRFVMRMK